MATMPIPSASPSMSAKQFRRQICPHCGSKDIHRCRARGIIERHVVRAFVSSRTGAQIATGASIFTWFPRLRFSSAACEVDGYSMHVGRVDVLPDGEGRDVEKQWHPQAALRPGGSARD